MRKDGTHRISTTLAIKLQGDSALRLTVLTGTQSGQTFTIHSPTVAGFDPGADLNIDDPLVCPRHLRFEKDENWWIVKDMMSENGTFLNGVLIKKAPVFPDSILQIGNTQFRVDYVQDPVIETAVIQRRGEWVQLPGIIAHELKNYLHYFSEGIEQLKNDTVTMNRFSGEIRSFEVAGERMKELVQMLRDGCSPLNVTEIDLVELVWEQVSLIETAAHLAGITLEISLPDGCVLIDADANQLGRCILNLMKNALEACERSQIINIMLTQESDHHLTLIVRDTGKGMDSETLESMWTPLFTTREEGNGLGAFIARTVVLKHKGRIHAESKPGKGTVIRIELPRRQA
ncbi:FHA domain-containing protein [bacterium]|nr:FHA domain-containing protein [candidate division CSSED10-310 bacterium]